MNGPDLRTIAHLPAYVAERFEKPVLLQRCREPEPHVFSTAQAIERIDNLRAGLVKLGLAAGDRVAILSESRPEWTLSDLAILSAGAVSVPIYPTLSAAQSRFILQDSGARFAIVSDEGQAAKLQRERHHLPGLQAVLVVDATPRTAALGPSVLPLEGVIERGRAFLVETPGERERLRQRAEAVAPEALATIIYTSGTTGEPKGVMLSHHNLVSNVIAVKDVLQISPKDVALSFLPLSHSFERLVVYLYLYKGVTVAFAESVETIARDMLAVRPTIMTGVPRVYEKVHARVLDNVAAASGVRRRLFGWALSVGLEASRAAREGRPGSAVLRLQHAVADRLVFSKIRARTGGRVRLFVSGSAPLPVPIAEFFHAVGLRIMEGYGLTETAPVLTVNPLNALRFGTVGPPIPGVEIRIAEDGEILARGPNLMMGYYNQPEATAEVLRDGWFHTGDIGRFDEAGYLIITDRKKDLVVTSGGKNIAPQPIENQLRRHPLVAEALVIGDKRRFPAVLIVPDFATLADRLQSLGRPSGPREELVRRPDVVGLYQEIVDALNTELSQYERLKQIALIPAEFSVEGGELTPTLKVRRRVVEERYRDLIEEMYREAGARG